MRGVHFSAIRSDLVRLGFLLRRILILIPQDPPPGPEVQFFSGTCSVGQGATSRVPDYAGGQGARTLIATRRQESTHIGIYGL